MSLLEGHGDITMDRAGAGRVPSAPRFARVLRDRRANASPVAKVLQRLIGLEAKINQYAQGERFIEEVERLGGGPAALEPVWRGASWLPTHRRDPRARGVAVAGAAQRRARRLAGAAGRPAPPLPLPRRRERRSPARCRADPTRWRSSCSPSRRGATSPPSTSTTGCGPGRPPRPTSWPTPPAGSVPPSRACASTWPAGPTSRRGPAPRGAPRSRPGALLGHTADDQAETVLLNLLRGASLGGLAGFDPAVRPIRRLRRAETHGLCAALGLEPVADPSNLDPAHRRNRVRHELLPLLDAIAERDVAAVLARQADLVRDDDDFLDELALAVDPTDARALAAAPPALARARGAPLAARRPRAAPARSRHGGAGAGRGPRWRGGLRGRGAAARSAAAGADLQVDGPR